jgi:hypothetical protein
MKVRGIGVLCDHHGTFGSCVCIATERPKAFHLPIPVENMVVISIPVPSGGHVSISFHYGGHVGVVPSP